MPPIGRFIHSFIHSFEITLVLIMNKGLELCDGGTLMNKTDHILAPSEFIS